MAKQFSAVPLVSEYAVKIFGSGHVVANNRIEFFHDGIDHASYGDPDGWPDKPVMPSSIDIVGNDIRNLDDNCIEADGAAQNVRVMGNRCFNMAHRALSTQPSLGGPIYFIRNIVYNAPEGGAVKFTANGAGVLVARAAAIDKGQVIPGITDGFTGAGPDLGALERGKPAPHYGPRPIADQL